MPFFQKSHNELTGKLGLQARCQQAKHFVPSFIRPVRMEGLLLQFFNRYAAAFLALFEFPSPRPGTKELKKCAVHKSKVICAPEAQDITSLAKLSDESVSRG